MNSRGQGTNADADGRNGRMYAWRRNRAQASAARAVRLERVPDIAGVSTPSPMSMEVEMMDTHHSATWALGGEAAGNGTVVRGTQG